MYRDYRIDFLIMLTVGEILIMFKPLALFIGLRYTRAKRRNHFISFISLSSMLGICLGVATLITVLSVMNGFDEEIHHRFFSMAPEITIRQEHGPAPNWLALRDLVKQNALVKGVSPYIAGQGLLTLSGQSQPVFVTGITPRYEAEVTTLADKMVHGSLNSVKPGSFAMVVGETIAENLGLNIGDKVNLLIPQVSVSPVGMTPRFKAFTIAGIFSAGPGFSFDSSLTFIDQQDAQALFSAGQSVKGLRVRIKDVYAAPALSKTLQEMVGRDFYVGNWTQQYGPFFNAIKMEKTMMFLILSLIIFVAAFNLVSSLVMVVNDKQADIAILRTFGALPRTILSIFIVQGLFVGVIGTLFGLILGLLLATHTTEVVDWIQSTFHTNFVSSQVYFLDYLPSKIVVTDIIRICCSAFIMSFLATLYPAWRASRIQPAEALRYE